MQYVSCGGFFENFKGLLKTILFTVYVSFICFVLKRTKRAKNSKIRFKNEKDEIFTRRKSYGLGGFC